MEVNTRLQVEHPVTELVTGLDLVEWQIRVARGEALPLTQEQVRFDGHAIEVRLCAEDEQFVPHSGRVRRFDTPVVGDGLRFDHAIESGLDVSPYYDSMLGKLIAHAPTREQAIDRLAGALDRLVLLGLPTNRRFLAACLRHPEFRAGRALIPFLSEQADPIRAQLQAEECDVAAACGLEALLPHGPSAALPSRFVRPLRLRHRGATIDVALRESERVAVPNAATVRLPDGSWHVQQGAIDLFIADASFDPPGASGGAGAADDLRAPFNGKVIATPVAAGAAVARGDTLVILESMKLEHVLAAARDGIVRAIHVEPGQQAATSQVLVSLEPVATP
jgi:geranyl-CoA carboxylase alpha subunit